MKKYNLVIVDDHSLFSNSLKKLLESFGDYAVIKQCKDGREFIDYLNLGGESPDLVLLDVKMQGMDGKETMRWIFDYKPNTKVLILSMDDDESTILYMLRHGAKGYVLKDTDPSHFKLAIEHVIQNGFYHSELVSNILIKELNKPQEEKTILNDRELQFLDKVCTDLTYKEIASEMFLSPKTIDGYRATLFKKLNVKSRVGLAMYAIKSGLVKI